MAKQEEKTERREPAPEFWKPLDETPSGTIGKAKRILSK
jgi:hypothetical protein